MSGGRRGFWNLSVENGAFSSASGSDRCLAIKLRRWRLSGILVAFGFDSEYKIFSIGQYYVESKRYENFLFGIGIAGAKLASKVNEVKKKRDLSNISRHLLNSIYIRTDSLDAV